MRVTHYPQPPVTQRVASEFRTTFRAIPAPVAQWIEQRFPKPQVAGSSPAGGADIMMPPHTTCGE